MVSRGRSCGLEGLGAGLLDDLQDPIQLRFHWWLASPRSLCWWSSELCLQTLPFLSHSVCSGLIWKLRALVHTVGILLLKGPSYYWMLLCSPNKCLCSEGHERTFSRRGRVGLPWICPSLIQPGSAPGVFNCHLLVLSAKIIWAHSLYLFFLPPQSPGLGLSQIRCWTTWVNW